MIKYAVVVFLSEKKRRYVVPVKDIKNFHPKSVEDFRPTDVYEVNWPVLRREDSNTTERSYEANILLLAASTDSLVARAKAAGVALPSGFKTSISIPRDKKSDDQMTPVEDAVTVARRASKRTKKQVNAALIISCKQRMAAVLGDGHSDEASLKELSKGDICDKAALDADGDNLDDNNEDGAQKNDIKDKQEQSDDESRIPCKKAKNARKRKNSGGSSDSSGSYESSTSERVRLQKMLEKKNQDLEKAQKRILVLEVDNNCKAAALKKWEQAFTAFSNQIPRPVSPVSPVPGRTAPTPRSDKSKQTREWVLSARSQQGSVKKINDARKVLDFEVSNGIQPRTPSKAGPSLLIKSPLRTPSRKDAFDSVIQNLKSPAKVKPSIQDSTPSQMDDSSSIMIDAANFTLGEIKLGEISSSPKKSPQKKKKKKVKPAMLEPHEKMNNILYKDILAALKGEKRLETKHIQAGKRDIVMVCLGNNVWIKQSLWEDKISKSNIKHSILVRDLAEEIWGYKKCAQMSLAGGKSPKTPTAEAKQQAPRGAVEAILAVIRAKKFQEGMTVEKHLDEYVLKEGEQTLREKLRDCAGKYRKERQQAEKKAAEALAAKDDE